MYDLIVIGGGPAGLTAMIYAIRKRLNVMLVSMDLGGKANWRMAIPGETEYHQIIRGLDMINNFQNELEYLKFARTMESVTKVEKEDDIFTVYTKASSKLKAKAVILATGARIQRMDVPGEREFLMKGLSYSALSYAQMFVNKKVAVVGDGNLALRSTAELATVADHVYLITTVPDAYVSPMGKTLENASNVTVYHGHTVENVFGDKFAEGLEAKGQDGSALKLYTDGIFVEKALLPNYEIAEDLVELKDGKVLVDCQNATKVPGLFAAGDVSNNTEQILVAIGEGAKAAINAYNYLLPTLKI